ncbi:hypothetical protein [uncultured Oscillibacter sp.]|nr:hypothetical protein [uncultured Oscillibacter sp.]
MNSEFATRQSDSAPPGPGTPGTKGLPLSHVREKAHDIRRQHMRLGQNVP